MLLLFAVTKLLRSSNAGAFVLEMSYSRTTSAPLTMVMPASKLLEVMTSNGEIVPGKPGDGIFVRVMAVPAMVLNDKWSRGPFPFAPEVPQNVLPAPKDKPQPSPPEGASVVN